MNNLRKHNHAWAGTCGRLVIVVCHVHGDARGDALVVTRAMKASTIAQICVEERDVRVEIEIGAEDFAAFKNLLLDESFQRLWVFVPSHVGGNGRRVPGQWRLLTVPKR